MTATHRPPTPADHVTADHASASTGSRTDVDVPAAGTRQAGIGLTIDEVRVQPQSDVERRQARMRIAAGVAVAALLAGGPVLGSALSHRGEHTGHTSPPAHVADGQNVGDLR